VLVWDNVRFVADIRIELRDLGGFASPFRSATPVQNPYNDPAMQESDADRSFSQSTLLQTKQQQQRTRHDPNEALIAQRENEIEQIANGIIDLANIFQELQTMVIDQGTMLDRIDYNVERMSRDVKEADKELKVASGYQKRSIKRKVMLLLAILIAGVFILLSLKLSRKGGESPAPAAPDTPVIPDIPDIIPDVGTIRIRRPSTSSRTSRSWHRRKRRIWEAPQDDSL
jgi:syntaxin 16